MNNAVVAGVTPPHSKPQLKPVPPIAKQSTMQVQPTSTTHASHCMQQLLFVQVSQASSSSAGSQGAAG